MCMHTHTQGQANPCRLHVTPQQFAKAGFSERLQEQIGLRAGLPSDRLGKGPGQEVCGGKAWTARPGVMASTTHTQDSEKRCRVVSGQSPASKQGAWMPGLGV